MTDTTGRQLAAATTIDEHLDIENSTGQADRFAAVDKLTAAVMAVSFAGKAPVKVAGDRSTSTPTLQHLPVPVRSTLATFDLAAQQAKGAWWLPDSVVLKPGSVNLPAYYLTAPQFAMNAALTDNGRAAFAACPDALACWALLAPFADTLTAPLMLRGTDAGALEPPERDAAWAQVDANYTDLGLLTAPVAAVLDVLRPGNGWSRLGSTAQVEARRALVAALAGVVSTDTVARWRAGQLRPLLDRYYAKAKKSPPTAQAVLTKALHPIVAAFFAGDWLAVLDYLGEQPAPGEEITTTLPEPRLYVQASAKVEQVAAAKNLPVDDVARMLASYLGSDEMRSPVERRVEVLRTFWQTLDRLHAGQKPGMPTLMGLVGQRYLPQGNEVPFLTPTYETALPQSFLAEVETLWGGELVARYPDRIVSTLFPHARMADAFGPGLRFWHDVAVTAWYICEGPYARTDLKGMAEFYQRDTDQLAEADTPVDPTLFADLKAAEKRLGRREEIWTNRTVTEVVPGLNLETAMGGGSRRDGFEILRDIITAHRRAWAAEHLERSLGGAWEGALRDAARELNRAIAGRGKLPTVKQMAKLSEATANLWFGGDLTAMYVALGEKPPTTQQHVRLLPYDTATFCNRLFDALGGHFVPNSRAGEDPDFAQSWPMQRVVSEAPRLVQLEELLGRPPTAGEFHAERYNWPDGLDYDRFAATVVGLRQQLPTERSSATPTAQPSTPRPNRVETGAATHPYAPPARPQQSPDRPGGILGRLFGRRGRTGS